MMEFSPILLIAGIIFSALLLITVLRLLTGKTNADKMIAFDVINVLVVIIMFVLSIAFDEPIFIDIAIVYSLLSFVATIYIGKYLAGDLK